jgi:hypothetical protein
VIRVIQAHTEATMNAPDFEEEERSRLQAGQGAAYPNSGLVESKRRGSRTVAEQKVRAICRDHDDLPLAVIEEVEDWSRSSWRFAGDYRHAERRAAQELSAEFLRARNSIGGVVMNPT